MANEQKWHQEIYEDLMQNKKRLVFIAGGSGSGKSHNAENLRQFLQTKGLKALCFSTDNFYKGLSWIIAEKTLNLERFKKYRPHLKEITRIIKEITEYSPFGKKFNDENFSKVMNRLSTIVEQEDLFGFVTCLKYEQENMDFDDPFDIDFEWVVDTITKLNKRQEGTLSVYSFDTSEIVESKIAPVDGKDYDVIIVEGLYILRPEIIDNLGEQDYVSASIICDPITRLLRRWHRDIKKGRSTLTPEESITNVLKNCMPRFTTDIEPTLRNSEYGLKNLLTESEINNGRAINHQRHAVTTDNYEIVGEFLTGDFASMKKCEEIEDIYFSSNNIDSDVIFRLRVVNNNLHSLHFIMGNKARNRHLEEFPLHEYFSDTTKVNEFVELLKNSGLQVYRTVRKTRETYSTNVFERVEEFSVEYVENGGVAVKLENMTIDETLDFVTALKLKKMPSYSFELISSEAMASF